MGKAYANRKPKDKRPLADYYPTPQILTKKLIETNALKNYKNILEPACGNAKNISVVLENAGFTVHSKDLIFGDDFLQTDYSNHNYDALVTNPPFSLFDEFVVQAKKYFDHFFFIGKVNFFGGHQRHIDGIWKNLKNVWIFDRMVNYSEKNLYDFDTGVLVTGWFEWDKSWENDWWMTHIIDVQDGVRHKNVR